MKLKIHKESSTIVLNYIDNKGIALSSKLTNYPNIGIILFWTFESLPKQWIEI